MLILNRNGDASINQNCECILTKRACVQATQKWWVLRVLTYQSDDVKTQIVIQNCDLITQKPRLHPESFTLQARITISTRKICSKEFIREFHADLLACCANKVVLLPSSNVGSCQPHQHDRGGQLGHRHFGWWAPPCLTRPIHHRNPCNVATPCQPQLCLLVYRPSFTVLAWSSIKPKVSWYPKGTISSPQYPQC